MSEQIKKKKLSIFVDVQNVYYTTRSAFKRNFDYNHFWASVTKDREVVNAYAYAINRGDEKQLQFQNILRAIGFEVKLKPFIQRSDGTAKGDWDVGITIDVLECAKDSDVIVLVSGDGDFDILVNTVREKYQSQVEVYGVETLTAQSLMYAATQFNPIEGELLL
ncbi:NYN domain-containing protein [Pseudoalteromonas sp. SMS1]|uniref:LabA-like NYN domain-containing protein n=1 Tax=Pseudoalteromonas sp. SMS1 TaxID=2908894 RepID=UPI001F44CDBF|nr:NYN domain-containing protein [Pseudoalteromonas sp. SMS1]MCF2857747.1 NYN domain-containing protein [Pseudoalteromonas sp. SMS1]